MIYDTGTPVDEFTIDANSIKVRVVKPMYRFGTDVFIVGRHAPTGDVAVYDGVQWHTYGQAPLEHNMRPTLHVDETLAADITAAMQSDVAKRVETTESSVLREAWSDAQSVRDRLLAMVEKDHGVAT